VIVRILGDGRYEVPEADLPAIEHLDEVLMDAVERGDEAAFGGALADLVGAVHHGGRRLDHDDTRTSGMVVPHEGSTLAEVQKLLAEEEGA
jgi:hypothetical protein